MAFISTVSGVSLIDSDRTLHVVSHDTDSGEPATLTTFDLKNRDNQDFLPMEGVRELISTLSSAGQVYMTADTYSYLRFQSAHHVWPGDPTLVQDEQITAVFPARGHMRIETAPMNDPATDQISRWAAYYYYHLNHASVRRWDGTQTIFPHRAANTLSYRSYAPYHNVKKEQRHQIRPVNDKEAVLQFDWSAAEWNLILQVCGYQPAGTNAYEQLAPGADSHESAKLVTLQHIYGAARETLFAQFGQQNTQAVINNIERSYPNVAEWLDYIKSQGEVMFEGFRIDLGQEVHKRPNRFAQTALQLCKWELMSRLAQRNAGQVATGDLHDQLIWHVSDQQPDIAQSIIEQVRLPLFGRYNIHPDFTVGATWR